MMLKLSQASMWELRIFINEGNDGAIERKWLYFILYYQILLFISRITVIAQLSQTHKVKYLTSKTAENDRPLKPIFETSKGNKYSFTFFNIFPKSNKEMFQYLTQLLSEYTRIIVYLTKGLLLMSIVSQILFLRSLKDDQIFDKSDKEVFLVKRIRFIPRKYIKKVNNKQLSLRQYNKLIQFCLNSKYHVETYNINQMNNAKAIFFTVAISLLLGNINALNWQGYGNMSSSNLTDIWTFIDQNIADAAGVGGFDDFCTKLSDHLNTLWDPAWNVYVTVCSVQSDTVVYGYAFRDHWMWYNGYQLKSYFVSFVIWKDYNCQTWSLASISSGFSAQEKADINAVKAQIKDLADRKDIWMVAKRFMNALVAKSNFKGPQKAYSMIIIEAKYINVKLVSGRICIKGSYQTMQTII